MNNKRVQDGKWSLKTVATTNNEHQRQSNGEHTFVQKVQYAIEFPILTSILALSIADFQFIN